MRLLLDTNVLSEPLREHPDPDVMRQLQSGEHVLHTASVVIHELSYGIHRLDPGRRRQRLASYLDGLLAGGLTVLPYDRTAALRHGAERARLEALGRLMPFADGQIAAIAAVHGLVLVTRNTRDFTAFQGLEVRNWFTDL